MSQCFHEIPSAKRGVIGPRDLQSVLTLTAQNLGVPPQLLWAASSSSRGLESARISC